MKLAILEKFAPGLVAEVNRLIWLTEAMHDLLILQVPYTEQNLDISFQNVKHMEPDLVAGNATIQDRQASLIEALRRGTTRDRDNCHKS